MLDCLLFTSDPVYGAAAIAAGIAGLVVDWEWQGKADRQAGRATEVNHGTVDDLVAIRRATGGHVVCRINNTPRGRDRECRLAIEHGADEVWLPMVRSPRELEQCLRAIDGRARLGTMVETREAMRLGREFARLPLAHAYVGLNDYRIDNGHAGLFEPMVDGTIDRFRADYPGALGVAGITRPDRGVPVPQRLLLADMLRLGCSFGVARRGFRADIGIDAIADGIAAIGVEVARLQSRSNAAVAADQASLAAAVAGTRTQPASAASLHAGYACAS
jgi:hypothetical protein